MSIELVVAGHIRPPGVAFSLWLAMKRTRFGQALADVACNDHDVVRPGAASGRLGKAPVYVDVQIGEDPELHGEEVFSVGRST